MDENQEDPKPIRTLRQHFWNGIVTAQRRRPASFYMLLAIPVVLVLALGLFQAQNDPKRFAFGLSILFIFLGVVLIRACRDIFMLMRVHLAESRQSYRETLGDEEFLETLRNSRAQREESGE